ncbi:hypothetical protein MMC10_008490 [Thelotrema lepadinum]|nr:hypothetical protein [Thelotrema lepadinum]
MPERCELEIVLDQTSSLDGYLHYYWDVHRCDRGYQVLENGTLVCKKYKVTDAMRIGQQAAPEMRILPDLKVVTLDNCKVCKPPLRLAQNLIELSKEEGSIQDIVAAREQWNSQYSNIARICYFPGRELAAMQAESHGKGGLFADAFDQRCDKNENAAYYSFELPRGFDLLLRARQETIPSSGS